MDMTNTTTHTTTNTTTRTAARRDGRSVWKAARAAAGAARAVCAACTALLGVGAATATLALAPAAPAHAVTNGVSDYVLAAHWAPVFLQDTDSSNYRGDYITRFDYDGDFLGTNNWNNLNVFEWSGPFFLPKYALPAYVYYNVAETESHYFITYAAFHPQDWHESSPADRHENDMEGVLVMVKKNGTTMGAFQLMVTVAHTNFYSYKDYQGALSSIVVDGGESIDGDVQFWNSTHPYVYSEAKGHGLYGAKRWETGGYPGGDGVNYYPRPWSAPEVPTSGNDRYVPYELLSLKQLWDIQWSAAGFGTTYHSWGTFLGDADHYGKPNAANAPWGWDDDNDGDVNRGDIYLRPAYLVERYHRNLGWVSHRYIHSTDGAQRW